MVVNIGRPHWDNFDLLTHGRPKELKKSFKMPKLYFVWILQQKLIFS